eukprot:3509480-Prymnesium_polylepis.2
MPHTRHPPLHSYEGGGDSSWDVLLLGFHAPTSDPLGDDMDLFGCAAQGCAGLPVPVRRVTGTFFGSFAFAVRRGAASSLLRALFPTTLQFDSTLSQANMKRSIRVVALKHPLLRSKPSDVSSDVQFMPFRCGRKFLRKDLAVTNAGAM